MFIFQTYGKFNTWSTSRPTNQPTKQPTMFSMGKHARNNEGDVQLFNFDLLNDSRNITKTLDRNENE